jgi:hypothetical protein
MVKSIYDKNNEPKRQSNCSENPHSTGKITNAIDVENTCYDNVYDQKPRAKTSKHSKKSRSKGKPEGKYFNQSSQGKGVMLRDITNINEDLMTLKSNYNTLLDYSREQA